jgi:hypothetical protein
MRRVTTRDLFLGIALGVGFAVFQLAWFVAVWLALYLLGGMDGYAPLSKAFAIAMMFAPTLGITAYIVLRR